MTLLTRPISQGARHGEPVAGYSSTGGLRDAHARPLRRQPAGRPGAGKNAAKDEEDRNHEIAALPTFSNRQDQYTFRSPVTDLNRSGWHCCNLLTFHSLKAYTKQGPFPRCSAGLCCPNTSNSTMNPSGSRPGLLRLQHRLIRSNRWFAPPPCRVSRPARSIFPCMPSRYPDGICESLPLSTFTDDGLPRSSTVSAPMSEMTRLPVGSLSLRPVSSSLGNLQPLITQTLLPGTTKAYGQLLRRDFNPLD